MSAISFPASIEPAPQRLPDRSPSPPAEEAQEATWIRRAAAGDRTAFEQLYRRHVDRVYGLVRRLCGGHSARAEELTQDTFLRAWQRLPGFRGEAQFGTWLHRIAINVVFAEGRRRGRGECLEQDLEAVSEASLECAPPSRAPDLVMDLEQAIARLPVGARAVLVLYDIEGHGHEAIADLLGIASGTSKAHLHRARSLLRTWLAHSETPQ